MTDEGSPPSSAPLEFQLLLDSAAPPRADAPVWAGPAVGLDWSGVLDRALEQGMVPLLRRHLAAGAWEGVPPAVRAWLEARFAGWKSEVLEEYDAEIHEGTAHGGMSALIDLVARKP